MVAVNGNNRDKQTRRKFEIKQNLVRIKYGG